ncbi:uncharacterized protein ACIQIH_013484 [Cyanocitta cristata]
MQAPNAESRCVEFLRGWHKHPRGQQMKDSYSESYHTSPGNHHCCLGDQTPGDCQGISQIGTGGPAGRVRHSTAPEHRDSSNIATQPPGTVSAARPALAGHSGGCRVECSCPQIPGECDPRVMAILGSHGHSGNNIMSGPDMSSRNGKKHTSVQPRRGKGARCTIWEPAALVPCPASGEQFGGAHGGTAGAWGHSGSSWTGHEFLPAAGPAGHSNGSRGRNGKQREL